MMKTVGVNVLEQVEQFKCFEIQLVQSKGMASYPIKGDSRHVDGEKLLEQSDSGEIVGIL